MTRFLIPLILLLGGCAAGTPQAFYQLPGAAVQPSPQGSGPAVLLGPYWTVGVSAKSANPAAATAFVESLFSTEASLEWAKTAGLVPDRRSVLQNPFFATPAASDIHAFTALLSAPGVMTFPQRMPNITKVFPVMNTALQELIGTKESVDAILERAKSTLGW